MARRYRKRSKRKQEESLGELLATATAIITLFVTKGNLVATLLMMLIVGVGVPLIIKVYKQNKKKERYLTSGMADIDQMSGVELYDRSELTQFIGGNNIRSFVSAAYTQAQPSQQAQEPQSCPYCGGTLVKRYGKHGAFWGCSNFPTCRYTKNI